MNIQDLYDIFKDRLPATMTKKAIIVNLKSWGITVCYDGSMYIKEDNQWYRVRGLNDSYIKMTINRKEYITQLEKSLADSDKRNKANSQNHCKNSCFCECKLQHNNKCLSGDGHKKDFGLECKDRKGI